MTRRALLPVAVLFNVLVLSAAHRVSPGGSAHAGEIGWIEDYSLATDRSVPLKQLIPGTEDYYYYDCLYYQSTEQWEKVEETLKAWVARYNYTPRAIEIQNRQALLTYKLNPAADPGTHPQPAQSAIQPPARRAEPKAESADKARSGDHLEAAAQPSTRSADSLTTLQGFEDAALDWLATTELNA